MKKNNLLWSIIVVMIILSITGATVLAKKMTEPDDTETLKSKVREEMNYIDGRISSMINALNNITLKNYQVESKEVEEQDKSSQNTQNSSSEGSSSKTKETVGSSGGESSSEGGDSGSSQKEKLQNITEMNANPILKNERKENWDDIEVTVENLHSTWNTVLLDLYKLEINSEDILKFSNLLDQLTLNIKDRKKIETLENLTQMYSCIVGYIQFFAQEDELYKNVARTRESVFYAYLQVDNDNWDEVIKQLQNAENAYAPVVNNINHKEKEFMINKTYIALKELQNSIPSKDKDVFYIKYKNLLESLNFLMG